MSPYDYQINLYKATVELKSSIMIKCFTTGFSAWRQPKISFFMRFFGQCLLLNFYARPLPCRLPSRCGSPSHHPPGGIHFRWRGAPRTGTSGCAGSAASSPCCRAPASSASSRAHSPPSPRFDLLQPKQRRHSEM
jgi:hypothetical protein